MPTSPTMEFVHYLLGLSDSLVANKIELSMTLFEPILHLSFYKSHGISASKNAWLARLHSNRPKKTQAQVLMMTRGSRALPCSLCCFFFADENVLKVLSSLGGEGSLGLSQQLVMEVGPLVLRYIRSWEA